MIGAVKENVRHVRELGDEWPCWGALQSLSSTGEISPFTLTVVNILGLILLLVSVFLSVVAIFHIT